MSQHSPLSGEAAGSMAFLRPTRSGRLLGVLAKFERVFVLTHDNPDPDAIASGWALFCLIQQRLQKPVRLLGGGDIVRAENRYMMKLLRPPLELVREVPCGPGTAVVLVDSGLASTNHLLACRSDQIVGVIDHHPQGRKIRQIPYHDVRPHVAACASIVAGYLREQRITPTTDLATALLYALRTETRASETVYSRLDRSVLLWLTGHANPSHLAEIEDAPLKLDYYADLVLALQSTFLFGDTALCLLPRASGPEIVGEVADLLIRCEAVHRVLCGAMFGNDLLLSVRTNRNGDDAAELVRATLEGLGTGGGHQHRAGGKVPGTGKGPRIAENLQSELRARWLATCGVDRQRAERLVGLREIVENLYPASVEGSLE